MSLLFLWQIAGKSLPIRVTDRMDIRRVSILASVGLVRAEFDPPFNMHNLNQPTFSATVYEISPVGYQELNDFADDMNFNRRQLIVGSAVSPGAPTKKLSEAVFFGSVELDQSICGSETTVGLSNENLIVSNLEGQAPQLLRYSDLELDMASPRCFRGGTSIKLSYKEFLLLSVLLSRPGKVFPRELLVEKVWGDEPDLKASVLEMAIFRLCNKIDKNSSQKLLHSVRGMGYVLDELPLKPWSLINLAE